MNTLFFWLSKLVWGLLAPDSLMVILVFTVWILLWRKKQRWAKRFVACMALGMVFVGVFPVGEWLFYPLETWFPTNPKLPGKIDGLIALGGAEDSIGSRIWDQVELHEGAERLLSFMALARDYPEAKLVFSGGSGSLWGEGEREANLAGRLLTEHGLDVSRLILEGESRNTYENAILSRSLVKPEADETWILITTAWHMPRAVGVFRKADWQVLPYPVDHWTQPEHLLRMEWDLAGHLRDLKFAAKEWVGLLVYYVTGKTSAILPTPDPD